MIKRLLKILILAVVLLALAAIGILHFVDPNQYKETITATILKQTGQTLTIEGPINWRFSPLPSLEITDATLTNPTSIHKPLLSTKKARVEWALWSAFSGKILLNIVFQDLKVNLIRNNQGVGNWENLINHASKPKSSKPTTKPTFTIPSVVINSLDIKNGLIAFEDNKTQQSYTLKELNLSVHNLFEGLLGISNPISTNFKFQKQNTEWLDANLSCDWLLKIAPSELALTDIQLQLKLPAPIANTVTITGKATIQNFSSPIATANLNIKKLPIGDIDLNQINISLNADQKNLHLSPVTFNIKNAKRTLTATINWAQQTPRFKLSQAGEDFDIVPFANLAGLNNKLDGKANLKMNLTASGNTQDELLQTLGGNIYFTITQGKFYGIDFIKQLKNTQAKVQGLISALTGNESENSPNFSKELADWKNTGQKNDFTPFDALEIDTSFSNGISTQSKVLVSQSEYRVDGNGQLNLQDQTLQYRASLLLMHNPYPSDNKIANDLFSLPLHITITGKLRDPIILPDLNTYFQSALKYGQKKVIQQVVDKTINQAIDRLFKGG